MAIFLSRRYKFSDESEDLEKSISYSTEAILLLFQNPTELGSYVIETLFHLVEALLIRSQQDKEPGDLKHAVEYLRYLQDQLLETSNVTRSLIKVCLVCALAVQVELEFVDLMQYIGEMATLCHELFISCVEESLLVHTVEHLASVIWMIRVPVTQPPPHEAIECLREARMR